MTELYIPYCHDVVFLQEHFATAPWPREVLRREAWKKNAEKRQGALRSRRMTATQRFRAASSHWQLVNLNSMIRVDQIFVLVLAAS
jgi:hypothetical protein